jgi:hypothetical protein
MRVMKMKSKLISKAFLIGAARGVSVPVSWLALSGANQQSYTVSNGDAWRQTGDAMQRAAKDFRNDVGSTTEARWRRQRAQ